MIKVPVYDIEKVNPPDSSYAWHASHFEMLKLETAVSKAGYKLEYDFFGRSWISFEDEAEAVEFKLRFL